MKKLFALWAIAFLMMPAYTAQGHESSTEFVNSLKRKTTDQIVLEPTTRFGSLKEFRLGGKFIFADRNFRKKKN